MQDQEQLELIDEGKVATIRARSIEEAELTDTTCTPLVITEALPMRDLDPFSNVRSTVRAVHSYSLESKLDGLKLPWLTYDGRPCTAFQNHPFSDPMPFVEKAHYEMKIGRCVDLIVLCKDDPSTEWCSLLTSWYPDAPRGHVLSRPPEMWRMKDRTQYDEHPNVIEKRRVVRIAKARKAGWSEKRIAKIHGRSQANFVSVIYHFRGWTQYTNQARWPTSAIITPKVEWVRRPKLDLEHLAVRWLQET